MSDEYKITEDDVKAKGNVIVMAIPAGTIFKEVCFSVLQKIKKYG